MRKISDKKSKLLQKIKNHKFTLLLFGIVTAIFIWQHALYISWDFSTYVLNAKYLFANGSYFEILRPPLVPVILGLLSFAGWKAAEFIFIILVSALFAYSSTRLAKSIKFDPFLFYSLSLCFYLLNFGLVNGTELLSLALLEMFIVFLIENKYFSGLVLGLGALSRYTSIAFFPLIFLHLKLRNIIKSLLLFGGIIFLWLVYNFYKTGNFFTSLADQYANNILYREYIIQQINLDHIMTIQNILIPFFLIGFVIVLISIIRELRKAKKSDFKSFLSFLDKLKIEIIMILILVQTLYGYSSVPIKDIRYLFNLVLPTAYFSYVGIYFILSKIPYLKRKKEKVILPFVAALFFILNIILLFNLYPVEDHDSSHKYYSAIGKLNEMNLSDCYVNSNSWIKLNYYGKASAPFPREELVQKHIDDGKIIVLFRHEPEPDYVNNSSFINSFPILYENELYVILGPGQNDCTPQEDFEESYLEQIAKQKQLIQNKSINTNPCFTMFHNSSFFEKTCNFVNLNGFRKDENRLLE